MDGNRIAPSEFLGTILVVFQQPIGAGASFTGIISEYGQNEKDPSHAMGPGCSLERVTGIEPALSAWKAGVLPLNYTRINALKARWSGRQDSNLRHPAPKAGALPNCATSRRCTAASIIAEESKSAGKTLQAIGPCPSPLHPPYEHRPLTKFARLLPLSTRFTKAITTIRIYAPHFLRQISHDGLY